MFFAEILLDLEAAIDSYDVPDKGITKPGRCVLLGFAEGIRDINIEMFLIYGCPHRPKEN